MPAGDPVAAEIAVAVKNQDGLGGRCGHVGDAGHGASVTEVGREPKE